MGDAEYLAGILDSFTFNCRPLNNIYFLTAFQQIVLPIAYQYCPQLVLVAAGFDAAQGDPLGGKFKIFTYFNTIRHGKTLILFIRL